MYFKANEKLYDRLGNPLREARPNAKPQTNSKGEYIGFSDSDLINVTHGQIAMLALDSTMESDKKDMETDSTKWVRSVMKRETISSKISAALKGDGWVEIKDGEDEIVIDRLAQLSLKLQLTMTGPVINAFKSLHKEKQVDKPVSE